MVVSILVVVDCSRQRRTVPQDAPVSTEFQSLLWWIAVVNEVVRTIDQFLKKFQSLLWWIAVVNWEWMARHCEDGGVSILVVVDCSRQLRQHEPRLAERLPRFNPCCGGLQSSTLIPAGSPAVLPVSILVVVDCSRQRKALEQSRGGLSGFNPCCGGLQSSTSRWWPDGALDAPEFQSLLWWIAVVNSTSSSGPRRVGGGFNPCCGGLQSSTGLEVRQTGPRRFQSLLWWIESSTPRALPRLGTEDGFQSLLWWIAVVNQRDVRLQIGVNILFQSLLWWIAVVNKPHTGEETLSQEVSILVVVDCSRQRPSSMTTGGPASGFNPCCGGLQSSTRSHGGRRSPPARVSILVVVDCSRQLGPDRRVSMPPWMFQSLLWWIAVVNSPAPRPGQGRGRVSILVVVDCSRQLDSLKYVRLLAIRFQSLLWWIAVVNRDRQGGADRPHPRFNPCCGGLQSSTCPAKTPDSSPVGFNPCCGGLQSSTLKIHV